jgi:hypothetical protein
LAEAGIYRGHLEQDFVAFVNVGGFVDNGGFLRKFVRILGRETVAVTFV